MAEIDLGVVKKRSVRGVVALTSRTIFLQIINFFSMFLLTIFLAPEVFGVFFVVTAAVNFLNYFSDIGLAAALIQKKGPVTDEDLKTTFTIQQILVVFLVFWALLGSRLVVRFYGLSADGLFLFRALVMAFFLSSLKTIPSVLLERKLDFNRLIIPQIAETILFNLIAVIMAWQGSGIASFTWAVLVRGFAGLILMYLISPWRPGFAFHRTSARKLLGFGVPFQTNSLLALAKDDLLTVFLGKILAFSQVGFIGWAQKWANLPLRFIMDSVTKVTFPAYSRIQDNLQALRAGIEKALFSVCFLTFPTLAGLVILARPLTEILPRYLKWQPALWSLYFFCGQAALACVSTTLTNVLNATGRIKKTLQLMILWTGLTWIFTLVAIKHFSFHGVALAALLVATTVILPIRLVRQLTDFSLWENVGQPFLGALFMAGVLYWLRTQLAISLWGIAALTLGGAIIYLTVMWFLAKPKLIEAVSLVKGAVKR